MAAKLGSFRHSFAEKREKERLLSSSMGFPELVELREPPSCFSFGHLRYKVVKWCNEVREFATMVFEMGKSDPKKVVFSAKAGLALTLLSFLIFLKGPFEGLGRYSVWPILTVVVVFESTIGATLSKGFNYGLGTLSAGGLALGMAMLLSSLGGYWDQLTIIISILVIGFIATYLKLFPTLKAYEFGIRAFLLTYCFIMVSGYKTGEFVHIAVTRFLLIILGAGVTLVINTCIYPIWAGKDLHNMVVNNFMNVATSLEGCVNGYLNCIEYHRVPSKILNFQAFDDPLYKGYKSAIESASQEDSLAGFASWEPPHGPYKMFSYPWKSYTKLSGALRHCAFMVMALHGCVLSEIQAPPERRQVFHSELQRVGNEGAKVLRQLGKKINRMEKLGLEEDILYEAHEAAEALQKKIDQKSYLLVNSKHWEIGTSQMDFGHSEDHLMVAHESSILEFKSLNNLEQLPNFGCLDQGSDNNMINKLESKFKKQASMPSRFVSTIDNVPDEDESKAYESASVLSLATFASLLIEFVARLENLVDAYKELCEKANFKEPNQTLDA